MRIQLAPTLLVLAAISTLGGACSSANRGGAGTMNPNEISQTEITRGLNEGVRDLQELIARIRPRWLQVRGDRSLRLETSVAVYQNNSRLGGLDALRGYPLTNINSVRYLDAAQAGLLPGAAGGHIEGAIVIATSGRGSE
jgi:hypothetical protein